MNEQAQKELMAVREYDLSKKERTFKFENEAGQKEIFVYDFNVMSVRQVNTAKGHLNIALKLADIPPNTVTELQDITKRAAETYGLGDILTKMNNGKPIPYDINDPAGFKALDHIKGDDVLRLYKCRDHFLFKAGLSTGLQVNQLTDLMNELKNVGIPLETTMELIRAGAQGADTEELIATAQKSTEKNMTEQPSDVL